MSSEIVADNSKLAQAMAAAGKDRKLRNAIFDALRQAELDSHDPAHFREQVRWPLILSLLSEAKTHSVVLENGLIFEVSPDSRIEQALLLSTEAHPDHVWEPQTTRLLTALAAETSNVIVGGAYIGDHVLFLARAVGDGVVHAFEPMQRPFDRLLHNLKVNNIQNVVANRMGLWDRGRVTLTVEGHLGLASSKEEDNSGGERIESISIDEYVESRQIAPVGLIMLDTEGGEEKALTGASETIARHAP